MSQKTIAIYNEYMPCVLRRKPSVVEIRNAN